MKKILIPMIVVVLGLLLLVACGNSGDTAPVKKSVAETQKAVAPADSGTPTKTVEQEVTEPSSVQKPRVPEKAPAGTEPVAILQTKYGDIEVAFYPHKAPNTVKNFIELCRSGFYNGTRFHRIIPGFMIQGGDPNTKSGPEWTWGQGGHTDAAGREITVKAEFNDIHHARGIVSMARAADPDSASSQFFICVADAGQLDHKYTAFGRVIKGMDVVDKIVHAPTVGGEKDREHSRPKRPVAVISAKIEYRPIKKAVR